MKDERVIIHVPHRDDVLQSRRRGIPVAHDASRGLKSSEEMLALEESGINSMSYSRLVEIYVVTP
jgi:hypothetical protein